MDGCSCWLTTFCGILYELISGRRRTEKNRNRKHELCEVVRLVLRADNNLLRHYCRCEDLSETMASTEYCLSPIE